MDANLERKLRKRAAATDGWKRAQAKLSDFSRKWPEFAAAIEQQRQRLTSAGYPADGDWIDCLDHIARMAERDPAGLSADEIERWALAWIDREKLRRKLHGELPKPEPPEPLTDQQQEAFDYIRENGPKSGKEICTALGIETESTFTRHYVPSLKKHGIRNRRGAGYYLPDSL